LVAKHLDLFFLSASSPRRVKIAKPATIKQNMRKLVNERKHSAARGILCVNNDNGIQIGADRKTTDFLERHCARLKDKYSCPLQGREPSVKSFIAVPPTALLCQTDAKNSPRFSSEMI
jgi:hypothetical protein